MTTARKNRIQLALITAILFVCMLAVSTGVVLAQQALGDPTLSESLKILTTRVHKLQKRVYKLEQEAAFTKDAHKKLWHYVKSELDVCDCRVTCVKMLGDTYRGPGGILDNCLTACRVRSYQNAK